MSGSQSSENPAPETASATPRRRGLIFFIAAVLIVGALGRGLLQSLSARVLGDFVWGPVAQSLRDADLPKELADLVRSELDRIEDERRAQRLSSEQLYAIAMRLSRGLLAKALALRAIEHRQQASLSSAEQLAIRRQVAQVISAALRGALGRRDLRPILEQYRAYGDRSSTQRFEAAAREGFMRELSIIAARAGSAEESTDAELGAAFLAAIKDATDTGAIDPKRD